jgi:hypothetical protein
MFYEQFFHSKTFLLGLLMIDNLDNFRISLYIRQDICSLISPLTLASPSADMEDKADST